MASGCTSFASSFAHLMLLIAMARLLALRQVIQQHRQVAPLGRGFCRQGHACRMLLARACQLHIHTCSGNSKALSYLSTVPCSIPNAATVRIYTINAHKTAQISLMLCLPACDSLDIGKLRLSYYSLFTTRKSPCIDLLLP